MALQMGCAKRPTAKWNVFIGWGVGGALNIFSAVQSTWNVCVWENLIKWYILRTLSGGKNEHNETHLDTEH